MTPAADVSSSRIQRLRAFTFACVAGYVDAYALLKFQVYASFMSGNTTRVGVFAATEHWPTAALNLFAIGLFLLGAFAAVVLLHSSLRRATNVTIAVAVGLLVGAAVLDAVNASAWLSVALLSMSMGALNATVSRIGGQAISIGYVSGGLFKLAEHLALALHRAPIESPQGPHDTHLRRAALIAAIWSTFLAGALLGALMQSYLPVYVLVAPIVALVVASLFDDQN